MIDAQDYDAVASDSIGNVIGKSWQYEFACSRNSSRPTGVRKAPKMVFDKLRDPNCDPRRRSGVRFSDKTPYALNVGQRKT